MELHHNRPISMYDNLAVPSTLSTSTHKKIVQPQQTTKQSQNNSKQTILWNENITPLSETTTPADSSEFSNNSNRDSLYQTLNKNHTHNITNTKDNIAKQQLFLTGDQGNCCYNIISRKRSRVPASRMQPATSTANATATTKFTAVTSVTMVPLDVSTTIATESSTATKNQNSKPRPISQHSNSDLYETSQSIAAVKAALNDAKSKFLGINNYNNTDIQFSCSSQLAKVATPAIVDNTPITQVSDTSHNYENIPMNRVIYQMQQQTPVTKIPDSDSQKALQSNLDTKTQSKHLPQATYKQIPLNDIDISQPSQAVYMTTTVPQNIKGSKIAGRHTPTRNSLRHSRMLVVNNNGCQSAQYLNRVQFNHPNWVRWILVFEFIIGVSLVSLAIWIYFTAPSMSIQNNPYWSGLGLLLSGSIGLLLVQHSCLKKKEWHEKCFKFLLTCAYMFSLLALLLCCISFFCAVINFVQFAANDMRCETINLDNSCRCFSNATTMHSSNNTTLIDSESTNKSDTSYILNYRDLNCDQFHKKWTLILCISIVLNTLGIICSFFMIALLICRNQNSRTIYSSVHTGLF